MDIIEKCQLITSNALVSNMGLGSNDEIDLEIYNEIKDEITKKLESIVNPIIQDYKNIKKKWFYQNYRIESEIIENVNLLNDSLNVHNKIYSYLKALEDVNKKINEITSKKE